MLVIRSYDLGLTNNFDDAKDLLDKYTQKNPNEQLKDI